MTGGGGGEGGVLLSDEEEEEEEGVFALPDRRNMLFVEHRAQLLMYNSYFEGV